MRFTIAAQDTVYRGYFQIIRYRVRHELFRGDMGPEITREVFERGHAAAVLPYDPARDEVVLIEQFRVGALTAPGGPWLLEIVAGVIQAGETPEDVVRREAIEEAGRTLQRLQPIGNYLASPGGSSERIFLFCGEIDAANIAGIHGLAEEHEDIRVTAVSFTQACDLLAQGRLTAASAVIALQWLQLHREELRRAWGYGV